MATAGACMRATGSAPPADGRAASTDRGANEACAPSAVRNRAGGRGVNCR